VRTSVGDGLVFRIKQRPAQEAEYFATLLTLLPGRSVPDEKRVKRASEARALMAETGSEEASWRWVERDGEDGRCVKESAKMELSREWMGRWI